MRFSELVILVILGAIETSGNDNFKNIPKKPNVVFLLTDDQDVELGSMNFMRKTLKRLRDEGAEMRRAYATTPMCCPSRSSLLTGRYVHNHNVRSNNFNCSSSQWRRDEEPHSFGVHLLNSGYRTGYFGKYLNQYDGSYVPPGWQTWIGLVRNSVYYNYTLNKNGKLIKHGDDYATDYLTDLIANESISFIHKNVQEREKPFFLFASFPAPHGPEDAAPQYSRRYSGFKTLRNPAYNHVSNHDKQWILQVMPKMGKLQKHFTDVLFARRLQTLASVDDAVERIYQALKSTGQLDNTYLIFTSDHGYHSGQFGLVTGKGFPFETDIRIPFLIRGPGVRPRTVIDEIILNIDFAPTFLDIAGVEIPERMDGRSFRKLILSEERKRDKYFSWPDTFLVESPTFPFLSKINEKLLERVVNKSKLEIECMKPGMVCFVQKRDNWKTEPFWNDEQFCACTNSANNTYECLRTINSTSDFYFCEFHSGPTIYYDLKIDPWQLTNRFSHLTAGEISYLRDQLELLKSCEGTKNCMISGRKNKKEKLFSYFFFENHRVTYYDKR